MVSRETMGLVGGTFQALPGFRRGARDAHLELLADYRVVEVAHSGDRLGLEDIEQPILSQVIVIDVNLLDPREYDVDVALVRVPHEPLRGQVAALEVDRGFLDHGMG